MPWIVRGLVVAQVACIGLIGASCRAVIPELGSAEAGPLAAPLLVALILPPAATLPVLLLARDPRLAPRRRWIVAVEALLALADFIALLPAVQ